MNIIGQDCINIINRNVEGIIVADKLKIVLDELVNTIKNRDVQYSYFHCESEHYYSFLSCNCLNISTAKPIHNVKYDSFDIRNGKILFRLFETITEQKRICYL